MTADTNPSEVPAQDFIESEWPSVEAEDENDFELPTKACDLSGEGTCEACQ